jgi:selenoprotein W-related protein
LAADLEKTFGSSVQIIESSGGVFEVERDGVLLYSKKALGRFPEEGEVLGITRALEKGQSLPEAQKTASGGRK